MPMPASPPAENARYPAALKHVTRSSAKLFVVASAASFVILILRALLTPSIEEKRKKKRGREARVEMLKREAVR